MKDLLSQKTKKTFLDFHNFGKIEFKFWKKLKLKENWFVMPDLSTKTQ